MKTHDTLGLFQSELAQREKQNCPGANFRKKCRRSSFRESRLIDSLESSDKNRSHASKASVRPIEATAVKESESVAFAAFFRSAKYILYAAKI